MTKQEYFKLLDKYEAGLATQEEERLLYAYYNLFDLRKDGLEDLSELQLARLGSGIRESIDQRILVSSGKDRVVKLWPRIAVAAATVATIVFGVWFFNASRHSNTPGHSELVSGVQDVAPGKNGATLTLANGEVVQLSDAKSGVVIASELKYSDGSAVRYSSGSRSSGPASPGQSSSGPVGVRSLTPSDLQGAGREVTGLQGGNREGKMLTASTAKGQTYQFILPDGTKVWLNADSKISFPSQFSGKERKILLDGEGYFEVYKLMDKTKKSRVPFIVKTGAEGQGQEVEVLGTHFNINSYADEIVTTTTLLEGSVRVNAFNSATGRTSLVLKPNQQSILNAQGAQVLNVDVSTAVGWKDGLFAYKNTPVSTVMRQIERWYNVSVTYDGADESLKERLLSGSVSRYDNVSGILKAIELTGVVKFKVKGRTITVYRQ